MSTGSKDADNHKRSPLSFLNVQPLGEEARLVRDGLLDDAERIAEMGSYVWDLQTNDLVWSDNLYRLNGFDPAQKPDLRAFFARVHPDDLVEFRENLVRAGEAGVANPMQYRLKTAQGYRTMQSRGVGVAGEDGKIRFFVGTTQDITAQRERESALEAHAHLLEEAQAISNIGSYTWRPRTGVIKWSPELYRITGMPHDHVPTVESFDSVVHKDDLERLRHARIKALESPGETSLEVRIVRPDGAVRRVTMHGRVFKEPDQWVMGIVHDVTAQRELEERLRRSKTMEAIGRLATGVAHDFNNLLTVITLNARMLGAHTPSAELDDIISAAGTAAELTQRLLSLGRASQTPLVTVDIDDAVAKAETMLARAAGEGLNLRVETGSGIAARADVRQLEQALLNLVLNARDATDDGGSITVRTLDAPEGGCFIDVIDNGSGMTSDIREKALDPFFTTKGRGMGTGLGLSMVHGALTNMNGTVSLHEAAGGGTRVRLWLPSAERGFSGTHRVLDEQQPLPPGTRILIVDDEDAVRNVTAQMLRRQGMAVDVAAGPTSALQFVQKDLDIVLCDVSMPDGGGLAVLDAFAHAEVPFVFMTGYGDADTRLDPYTVVSKPFFPAELTDALATALARGRSDSERSNDATHGV